MAYPYGIVDGSFGRRFLDEGSDTPDNTFEEVAYRIWRDAHQSAYLIADNIIHEIPGIERTIVSDRPPYSAPTLAELATRIDLDTTELEWTVSQYNSVCVPGDFDSDGTVVAWPL